MTSASSSIEAKRAPFAPLFGITLRQRWTVSLLIAIILFFSVPVPVMMMLSSTFSVTRSTDNIIGGADKLETAVKNMTEWSEYIRVLIIPMMSVLAVVMTCAMFSYLKNKVSVDFYHSLPVKRGRLYLNQLLSGYVLLMIPLVVMLAAAAGVIAFHGVMNAMIVKNILAAFWETVVYTLFFYGLSTLVGMVSGLTAVHLILTGVAIFIVPFIYVSSVYFISIFNENMWTDWYVNEEILAKLSPALRFVFDGNRLGTAEIIIWLILAAAFFVGAYAVYMHRKSERAGTSVVFLPLGEVIKYLVVFPMTLLGGLFFYYVMDSFGWTVFGMVCGAVLTFMLANTILNKTAKAMFRGWRTLCVYGGVIALCLILLTTNLFGINSKVPDEGLISKVEVILGDATTEFEFRDEAVIKALRELYTDGDWVLFSQYGYENADSIESPGKYYNYANRLSLDIVFYPKAGIPTAKSVTIYNKNEFAEQLRVILDSDEFREQYADMVSGLDKEKSQYVSLNTYDIDDEGNIYTINSGGDSNEHTSELLAMLSLDAKNVDYDYFQNPLLGNLHIYSYGYFNNYSINFPLIPVTALTENINSALIDTGYINTPIDEQIDLIAASVSLIRVTQLSTGEDITFTDPDKIREIVGSLSNLSTYINGFGLTLIDPNYEVYFSISTNDYVGGKYPDRGTDTESTAYQNDVDSYFLLGRTPDFVSDSFSK